MDAAELVEPPPAITRLVRRSRVRLAVGTVCLLLLIGGTFWRAVVRGDAARFPFDPDIAYHVERVIDGDTLLLDSGHRVRLLGVDTPETVHPTRPAEPFGLEASAFTRKIAEGQAVQLLFDRERLDKYDRILAWVFVDDRLLNEELVRAGLSEAVLLSPLRPDFRKRLIAAETEAAAEELGVHSLKEPNSSTARSP